jgi:hypothetical protein
LTANAAGEEALTQEFHAGDKVKWKSHGGEAHGHVEKKLTSDTEDQVAPGPRVEGRPAISR